MLSKFCRVAVSEILVPILPTSVFGPFGLLLFDLRSLLGSSFVQYVVQTVAGSCA
jgi:hypothetical protein